MAKQTKTPERMCVICREMKTKNELNRFTVAGEKVYLDKSGKMGGRGVYVCKNAECINKALQKNLLFRHLKVMPDAKRASELMEELSSGK